MIRWLLHHDRWMIVLGILIVAGYIVWVTIVEPYAGGRVGAW